MCTAGFLVVQTMLYPWRDYEEKSVNKIFYDNDRRKD